MTQTARRFLAFFLPAGTIAVLASLLVFVAVQQDLRLGANDPQEQLADDAVAELNAGGAPVAVVGSTEVNLNTSLAPFIAVYRSDGTVLATDGMLDGRAPVPPKGVLDTAVSAGRNAVTWQPEAGVRIATVVLPWQGGTVLAGRSLRRVEELESSIEGLVAAGALGLVGAVAVAAFVSAMLWPRREAGSADSTGSPAAQADRR